MVRNRHFPEIHGNFGFGCMRLPMKGGQVDYDELNRMADAFIGADHIGMAVARCGTADGERRGGSR